MADEDCESGGCIFYGKSTKGSATYYMRTGVGARCDMHMEEGAKRSTAGRFFLQRL